MFIFILPSLLYVSMAMLTLVQFFRFSDSHTKAGGRKTFNRLNSPLGTGTSTTFTNFSKSQGRKSKYKSNPFGITGFRFPGLRSHPDLPRHQEQQQQQQWGDGVESPMTDLKDKDGMHRRQRSFLDMDLEVQPEPEHHSTSIPGLALNCLTSPRPVSIAGNAQGERRILPIHHANMGGESPLSELVRYSPHAQTQTQTQAHESVYSQTSYAPTAAQGYDRDRDMDQSQSYFESFGHQTQPSYTGSGRTGMTAGSGWILGPSQPVTSAGGGSGTVHPWPRPSGPGGAL